MNLVAAVVSIAGGILGATLVHMWLDHSDTKALAQLEPLPSQYQLHCEEVGTYRDYTFARCDNMEAVCYAWHSSLYCWRTQP